jgi:hypothetical protein
VAAYRTLTGFYNEAMYAKHGPAFRNTTVGEVAMVDRELHEELYGYCEDGSTSFLQGLEWYTGKGYDDCKAFKILEQVPNTLPDRSIEFPPEATICNQMGATPPPEGPWAKRPRVATSASGSDEETCWKCGKSKMEHKRQRWCPGAASAKASGKSKAQPAVKRADPHQKSRDLARVSIGGLSMPGWMKGSAPCPGKSKEESWCYDFNLEGKGCSSAACGRSHSCPFQLPDGSACKKRNSTLFDHPH